MNSRTAEIFERFEVRKTRAQKTAFIGWVQKTAAELGYESRVEKCDLGGRNIVFGDIDRAKVVFTAHYDTCAFMPFPNFLTPKHVWIYILYQLALVIMIFVPVFLLGLAAGLLGLPEFAPLIIWLLTVGLVLMMLFGPANRHTANDNTSGVTAVLDTMAKMPPELRGDAAFVLFDLEEAGLIGSSSFYSKHKSVMKEKPLVNFDCISDGSHFLFVFRKKAKGLVDVMKKAFEARDGFSCEFLTKGYIYPSDQAAFPMGIGAASFNKKGNIHYMDKIHTGKDRVYEEANIEFISDASVKLTELL